MLNAIRNMQSELKSVEAQLKSKQFSTDESEAYLLGKKNSIVYHLQLLGIIGPNDKPIDTQGEAWKIYISELRQERQYWNRQLRSKSYGAILNQGYARGRVESLTRSIDLAIVYAKAK